MFKDVLNLEGVSVLDKEQQKTIHGQGPGTCGYSVIVAELEYYWEDGQMNSRLVTRHEGAYGVDKATATGMANQHGGRWCCDSCSTASWYSMMF